MATFLLLLTLSFANAEEIQLNGMRSQTTTIPTARESDGALIVNPARAKKKDCQASDLDALNALSQKAGLRLDEFLKTESGKAQSTVTDLEVKKYLESQEGKASQGVESAAIKSHLHMQHLIATYRSEHPSSCK